MSDKKSKWLRGEILNILESSKKGHVGGALSCVDILVALFYRKVMNLNIDKFILSKGHVSMALYPVLHDLGLIDDTVYDSCYLNGSMLGGHPDTNMPGIEIDSGSLGHGIGIAAGMALAKKHDGDKGIIYVLMGDGECNEGSVWETAMFAARPKQQLDNLVVIIDNNRISATDFTANGSPVGPLGAKFTSFGWQAISIMGHRSKRIAKTINDWKKTRHKTKKPLAIIANTIKGRGISYMYNNPKWHHGVPNEKQMKKARREINGS